MRKIISIVMMVAAWMGVAAQSLSVTDFKPLPNDLTANMAGTQVKDQNGEVAALIKVVTTQTGFTFEGGMAGIVKTQQRTGEIWVYVPHGIKKITILHQALGVLRDYYFPCAIEAACTYEMTLASGEVRTVVTQDAGASYLVLSVTPKKASVYVDGGMLDGDGSGDYMVALPYGEHQYRVEAGGYMPEAGVVQIGKEKSVLNISLKSALATLTIATTTAGTEIFVNDKRMGTGSWSGSLGAGTYILEGRLAGYRSQKTSVTLAKQDEKSVTLPALEAMYGMLNVSYKPVGAEVWVDGKKLGTSPDIFNNVLVGTHKVEIKKDGHVPYSESVTIAEGETKEFAGALNEIKYSDFQGKVPAAGTEARTMYDKAITGDADAQNKLGYWYETSEKDMASAVYWYRKSAELGYAKAQYNLGMCYYYGQGVSKDISKALKWWRRAAEQGLVDAQYNLATHISYYGDGDDVDKSIKEAVNWYRKAAEQGHIGAQCSLGECYEDGCGVSKDVSEAVKLYRKAAEQGEAWAQNRLGEIYYYGKGVSKDYYEAVKWYRKAAEQGEYWAQYGLGECYENGLGVGKDINEAVKWYRKAAEQGIGIAKKRLKDLGY
ncbi:MAG: PEGA domain-containing protein [Bacteroidales bacterium]|nr:PEGA domain-containing protein [Bacteroidales bacterium]